MIVIVKYAVTSPQSVNYSTSASRCSNQGRGWDGQSERGEQASLRLSDGSPCTIPLPRPFQEEDSEIGSVNVSGSIDVSCGIVGVPCCQEKTEVCAVDASIMIQVTW